LSNSIPESILGQGLAYRLSKNYNDIPAYISLFFNDIQRNKLYKPEFYEKAITKKAESYKLDLLENCYSEDIVTTLQEVDIRTYLVDDILTKVDRASMSNSIEVRVPLLDHELAELTFQMPVDLKLNRGSSKYILKEVMKNYLPRSVLEHKKQGFGVPLDSWFRSDLKDYSVSRLLSSDSQLYDFLDMKYVEKIFNNHFMGMRDSSPKIWMLLFMDEWLSQNA